MAGTTEQRLSAIELALADIGQEVIRNYGEAANPNLAALMKSLSPPTPLPTKPAPQNAGDLAPPPAPKASTPAPGPR